MWELLRLIYYPYIFADDEESNCMIWLKREGKSRAVNFPADNCDEKHFRGFFLKSVCRLLGENGTGRYPE